MGDRLSVSGWKFDQHVKVDNLIPSSSSGHLQNRVFESLASWRLYRQVRTQL